MEVEGRDRPFALPFAVPDASDRRPRMAESNRTHYGRAREPSC